MSDKVVTIIGGGLAGLITSIHLARKGVRCKLIEKRSYPFHRVCGEYISNEVLPYLSLLEAYPAELSPSRITRFQLTSTNGKSAYLPLDLGGFGISRYRFDQFLFQIATRLGVEVSLEREVTQVAFREGCFAITTDQDVWEADVVIGSFGKRSRLDMHLTRSFVQQRSPYLGVKYHIRLHDFPDNLIALHNFKDGYCGISRVEDNTVNLCYLTHRENVRVHGSIRSMEEAVLFKNPFIQDIFQRAEFLFEKPETINEISFETKSPVEQHILMAGDAAGMITPLCGNGMAMAIHSAKLVSEHVFRFCMDSSYLRHQLETDYAKAWRGHFSQRLWAGRQIQRLFGGEWSSNFAVNLARKARPVANFLISKTHGSSF